MNRQAQDRRTDNRLSARVPLRVPVRFEQALVPGGTLGCTEDLSLGGFRLRTQTPLPVGQRLRLELRLPSAGRARTPVEGQVAWARTPAFPGDPRAAMGIAFCAADDGRQELTRQVGQAMLAGLSDLLFDKLGPRAGRPDEATGSAPPDVGEPFAGC